MPNERLDTILRTLDTNQKEALVHLLIILRNDPWLADKKVAENFNPVNAEKVDAYNGWRAKVPADMKDTELLPWYAEIRKKSSTFQDAKSYRESKNRGFVV